MKKLTSLLLLLLASLTASAYTSNKIVVPDVDGYKTLKGEFHIHTIFSDGSVWPETRVREAIWEGLDVLSITDHIDSRSRSWSKRGILSEKCNRNTSYELAKEYRKALEFFPTLKDATPPQREQYQINKFGDAVRWVEIDEDIHITSLTDGAEPVENAISEAFRKFPFLNVSEVARSLGIHKSLLSKYIYGTKKPSEKREKEILDALREFGRQLAQI